MTKRKIAAIIIVFILIVAGGCGLWIVYRSEEKEKIVIDDDIGNIVYFEEGTEEGYACKIGGWSSAFIWDRYICLRHYKYKKKEGGLEGYAGEVDYARLEFFDLTTGEMVGKMNLKKV